MSPTLVRSRKSLLAGLVLAAVLAVGAAAAVPLQKVSSDPYAGEDSQAQHKTQVEPDTYAFGSTIVAAFQVGRAFGGGASNNGWATSTDGGETWTHGYLPGLTRFEGGGPYGRASDPTVAYSAKHDVWMISSLGFSPGDDVVVSRSLDGGLNWEDPVLVTSGGGVDKNWTACDNWPNSPFFGNCYTEWDNAGQGGLIKTSTSTNGGATWGPALGTRENGRGIAGQPLAQPNGTVVVPINTGGFSAVSAYRSTNGGGSWSRLFPVAQVTDHGVAGGVRTPPIISAEVNKQGKIYVVWQDCRFRSGCSSNDIVMTTSMNGKTWSPVTRIPIDPVNSTVDHFIPGVAVDPTTSGNNTRLGVTYWFYPNANCTQANCELNVGFIASEDGGASWSEPTDVAGPMNVTWLPSTSQGRMFGDYISTSFVQGNAFTVIPVAKVPNENGFRQAMFAPRGPLTGGAGIRPVTPADRQPVPGAASDHPVPEGQITLN